jgi:hypothetical protein
MVLAAVPASSQQYFYANLEGSQQVPPTHSMASGLGCFTLGSQNTLDYQVAYYDLSSPELYAHIHGPAQIGENAPAIFQFAGGTPKIGTFGPLTPTQVADLTAGLYYVNIHSTKFPSGEIRGQILPTTDPCSVPVENTTWGAIKALYE